MADYYISPTGSGTGDGSSWENAGTLDDLPEFIDAAGPGGTVYLRADMGAYQVSAPIIIGDGGDAGNPVTIAGVDGDGNPMRAEIVGTRAEPYTDGAAEGSEVFRLVSGADHLVFEDLSFSNVGNGCFRVGADLSDLTIQNVDAQNVTRFLEDNASGSATSATISGLVVRNVDVTGFSKNVIHLKYDTHDVLIEDVTGDGMYQTGGSYPAGVHLDGTVHDVVMRDVSMSNSQDAVSSPYWNGDGFATERGTYDILFENTYASGNADAGYDIKSETTVLIGAVSEDNNKNYRFWSDGVTMEDSVSLDPHHRGGTGGQAHIWLAEGASATITHSYVSEGNSSTLVFDLWSDGAHLTVNDTFVIKDPAATLSGEGAGSVLDGDYMLAYEPAVATTIAAFCDDSAVLGDGVTSDNTLILTGLVGSESGELVEIYDGDTLLGTVTTTSGGVWRFATETLDDGAHSFTAVPLDSGGADPDSFIVTVDTSAPAPVALDLAAADDTGSSSSDNITRNSSGLSVTGAGESGAKVMIFDDADMDGVKDSTEATLATTTVSDGMFSADISLASGTHTVRAVQTDAAGNQSIVSTGLTVTVDMQTPGAPTTLDLASADDSGSSSDNRTRYTSDLTVSGVGESGATVALFDDTNDNGVKDSGEATLATTTVSNGKFTADVALAAGTHHVRAVQTDAAGNTSSNSADLTIVVDDTAPATPTNLDLAATDDTGTPTDNITTKTSGLTISGSGETGSKVTLFDDLNDNGVKDLGEPTLNIGTVYSGTFKTDISLAPGTHHVRAIATDTAGNVSSVSDALDITVPGTSASRLALLLSDGPFAAFEMQAAEVGIGAGAFDRGDTQTSAGVFAHLAVDYLFA